MKKIIPALLALFLFAGCSEDNFIEGQFTLNVPADHPILDVWMSGLSEEEKSKQADHVRDLMNSQVYVFVKDETYRAYFFSTQEAINLPDENEIKLEKGDIDGVEVFISKEHEIAFRFEGQSVYVVPQQDFNYEFPLIQK